MNNNSNNQNLELVKSLVQKYEETTREISKVIVFLGKWSLNGEIY